MISMSVCERCVSSCRAAQRPLHLSLLRTRMERAALLGKMFRVRARSPLSLRLYTPVRPSPAVTADSLQSLSRLLAAHPTRRLQSAPLPPTTSPPLTHAAPLLPGVSLLITPPSQRGVPLLTPPPLPPPPPPWPTSRRSASPRSSRRPPAPRASALSGSSARPATTSRPPVTA